MNITSSGPTEALPLIGGPHFLNIDGTFGGTSVAIEWAEDPDGPWTALLNESEEVIAVTEAYNKILTVGPGFLRFNLTGGSSIDLNAVAKPIYRP